MLSLLSIRGYHGKFLKGFVSFSSSLTLPGLVFEACHHLDKLLELDLSVAVLVNLFDDCVDGLSRERVGASEAEHFSNLIGGDDTGAVLVEHAEGGMQLLS